MAVKIICEQCGTEVWRTPAKAAISRFCSVKCSGLHRRGALKPDDERSSRRYVDRPDHPLAALIRTNHIPLNRIVLYDKIGAGPHECHWCHKPIRWMGTLHTDAIVSDHLNNDWKDDSPDNLVAACTGCNGSRSRAIRADELFVVVKPDGSARTRATTHVCQECGRDFLISITKSNLGHGQFCGRPCAARNQFKTMGTPSQAPNYRAHNAVGDDELFIVHGGVRERAVQKNCRTCGKEFLVPKYNASKGGGKYCSHTCVARRDRSLDKGR